MLHERKRGNNKIGISNEISIFGTIVILKTDKNLKVTAYRNH